MLNIRRLLCRKSFDIRIQFSFTSVSLLGEGTRSSNVNTSGISFKLGRSFL